MRPRYKQLLSEQKTKLNSRVELDCENFSKESENHCNREKNFETKKIVQVIVSRHRANLKTISTRKRREQRRSCIQRLNKKCLKQAIDFHRLISEASHRINYFTKI
jgi:hypothetical protein